MQIVRAIKEPLRVNLSWNERWQGPDKGIISAWETGRAEATNAPKMAERAKSGELVVFIWKGGFAKKLVLTKRFGSLLYLAAWQGLRGEDLNVDLNEERTITCTKTGMIVTFTMDSTKFSEPENKETADEKQQIESHT